MATFLSIRLFAILFAISVLLSALLAYHLNSSMTFAVTLPPDAAQSLATRIQAIRAIGLAFALFLMLLVIVAAKRGARGALAMRWVLGLATSLAFLRGAGLIDPLAQHDALFVTLSATQLTVEAFAILLLYGEDATCWFDSQR